MSKPGITVLLPRKIGKQCGIGLLDDQLVILSPCCEYYVTTDYQRDMSEIARCLNCNEWSPGYTDNACDIGSIERMKSWISAWTLIDKDDLEIIVEED